MHPDKKREELEQKMEFERLQQEELIENEAEIVEEETNQNEQLSQTIEDEIEADEVPEKKRRRELIFELALFFILGILLGVTIKTEAVKRITIGFNDYQIESVKQRYDIAKIKRELEQKAVEQQNKIQEQSQQQAEQQGQPQQ